MAEPEYEKDAETDRLNARLPPDHCGPALSFLEENVVHEKVEGGGGGGGCLGRLLPGALVAAFVAFLGLHGKDQPHG